MGNIKQHPTKQQGKELTYEDQQCNSEGKGIVFLQFQRQDSQSTNLYFHKKEISLKV